MAVGKAEKVRGRTSYITFRSVSLLWSYVFYFLFLCGSIVKVFGKQEASLSLTCRFTKNQLLVTEAPVVKDYGMVVALLVVDDHNVVGGLLFTFSSFLFWFILKYFVQRNYYLSIFPLVFHRNVFHRLSRVFTKKRWVDEQEAFIIIKWISVHVPFFSGRKKLMQPTFCRFSVHVNR